MKKENLILVVIALGFLFLVLETRHSHAGTWSNHPTAYIPVAACGLGFLICLAGLAAEKKLATALGFIMIGLSAVGPLGVFYHTKGDFQQLQTMLTSNVREERLLRQDNQMGGPFAEKPLLAPMSISGLALISGILILGNRRKS